MEELWEHEQEVGEQERSRVGSVFGSERMKTGSGRRIQTVPRAYSAGRLCVLRWCETALRAFSQCATSPCGSATSSSSLSSPSPALKLGVGSSRSELEAVTRVR